MPVNFAELVATIELDNSKFDRAATATQQKLFDIAKQAERTDAGVKNAAKGLDKAATSATGFATSGGSLTGILEKLQGRLAGSSAVAGEFAGIMGDLGASGGPLALVSVGVVATGAALFGLTKHAADAGAEIHDLSISTGVSVETLSAFRLVAQQSGLTMAEFGGAVEKFDKLIGEAAKGSDEARKKLEQFAIDPQAALQDQEGALAAVFKRINDLPPGIQRVIAAQDAFGRSGAKMVDLIESAGGDFAEFKRQAEAAGEVISTKDAKAADDFNDKLDAMSHHLQEVARHIGTPLIPRLQSLADELDKTFTDGRDQADLWGRIVGATVDTVIDHYRNLKTVIEEVSPLLQLPAAVRGAGSYLVAPDAGFANAAPQGESAPTAPGAPTETDRAFIAQVEANLAAAREGVRQAIADAFKGDARKLLDRLQSEFNTLGNNTKVAAIDEQFRKKREEAMKLGAEAGGPALAALSEMHTRVRALAIAYDAKTAKLKADTETTQAATQAAHAYQQALAGYAETSSVDFFLKLGQGIHEATENVKLQAKAYGAVKDGQDGVLLRAARENDLRDRLKQLTEDINQAIAKQPTLLDEVFIYAQKLRDAHGGILTSAEQWQVELLRVKALYGDIQAQAKDFELPAIGSPTLKAPAGTKSGDVRIDPTIAGEPIPTVTAQIQLYLHQHATDLARDVTDIWEHSLTDLYQNGFKSFFADILGGFAQMAEHIALDYIEGVIGKALKNTLNGGGGSGGGFLGFLLSAVGIAAGGATGAKAGGGSSTSFGSFGKAFANGGHAEGWSMVGEQGPELAYFGGAGADIYSNRDSQRMLGQPAQSAGKTVQIHGGVNFSFPNVRNSNEARLAGRAAARDLLHFLEQGHAGS